VIIVVAVEQRRRPELRGKPVAVVQYNQWKGGGLIAVSYEARQCGVLRCMRGDDAKKICPEIELLRAPWADGKVPVNWYRDAGTEVRARPVFNGLFLNCKVLFLSFLLRDSEAQVLVENNNSDVQFQVSLENHSFLAEC